VGNSIAHGARTNHTYAFYLHDASLKKTFESTTHSATDGFSIRG
jgi:hypothetical protein